VTGDLGHVAGIRIPINPAFVADPFAAHLLFTGIVAL